MAFNSPVRFVRGENTDAATRGFIWPSSEGAALPFQCRRDPRCRLRTPATCERRQRIGKRLLVAEKRRNETEYLCRVARYGSGDAAMMECGKCEGPVVCQ